ncbi:ABC transporter substrate-binding protein [Streptomyces sp. NPDC020845]|uniref:ABC transporter substrate-binding protein n=1 Tax=Streptomyces sp. NPDC020845 TaxID=3365096 RepID=UPI0037AB1828
MNDAPRASPTPSGPDFTVRPDRVPDTSARALRLARQVIAGPQDSGPTSYGSTLSRTTRAPGRCWTGRVHGEAANGWLLSSAFSDTTALPAARSFAAAYRKRYGSAPGRYAAEAYDVVGLIAQALRELGPQGVDRESMARRLRAVRYRGITKTYAFERGNGSLTPGTALFLNRVEKGQFRFLGDYESATRA